MNTTIAAAEVEPLHPGNWPNEQRAALVVAALKRRHFQAQYAPSSAAAIDAILAMLPEAASVFRSESTTLDQLDVLAKLGANGKHKVTDVCETDHLGRSVHGDLANDPALRATLERQAFFADVFLTSATAVTIDGHIVSGGAHGKGVAPMIFGPAMVIVVLGMNKIVKDKQAAFERVAALHGGGQDPRLSYNSTGMLESALPRFSERINVILVGEDLGR